MNIFGQNLKRKEGPSSPELFFYDGLATVGPNSLVKRGLKPVTHNSQGRFNKVKALLNPSKTVDRSFIKKIEGKELAEGVITTVRNPLIAFDNELGEDTKPYALLEVSLSLPHRVSVGPRVPAIYTVYGGGTMKADRFIEVISQINPDNLHSLGRMAEMNLGEAMRINDIDPARINVVI